MARANKCPPWAFVFVGLCLLLPLACYSASSQTQGSVGGRSPKGLLRKKRNLCVDGTYEYNGRECCLCGAGLKLKNHCVLNKDDGNCTQCDANTYNSHPNFKQSCEPCTSCDHPNANLQIDEPCTTARNTKCKCKEDHYCINAGLDSSESCILCIPCTVCGAAGIKVACTATNNTVCHEEKNKIATAVGIVIGVFLLILSIVGLIVYLKIKRKQHSFTTPETLPLKDLQPHLVEIVEVVGWKDMKTIALSTKIPRTAIEFCERDNPRDTQQQTLQLLETWIESQGRNASQNLIESLQKNRKNSKAEKVIRILSGDSAA
ncbi:tumor necrosis factor receptor superfamily member 6 isoform X2 [Channa argus]|uniref:tumor necrosis factor receptor superfamily member 6 isoform X2 n=1 Tax=Channa argus TaxID=215402 RepID=UPI00351FB3B2